MSLSASLQKIDQRIFLKGEHQAAAVYLGQLALSGLSAADLAAQAAMIVNQVLPVEYSVFWELKEDGQSLFLMAWSGENESSSLLSPFLFDQIPWRRLRFPRLIQCFRQV